MSNRRPWDIRHPRDAYGYPNEPRRIRWHKIGRVILVLSATFLLCLIIVVILSPK